MSNSASPRVIIVSAAAAVALFVLALTSYSAYSQPELDTTNTVGLLGPMLAATVPALAAIALHQASRIGATRLILAGALIGALYFVIPLYIGLRQQSATNLQLSAAATFISWLAAAAGLAGALTASIVMLIHHLIQNRAQQQQRARILQTIEREIRDHQANASAIELGADAFAALTRDWGEDARTLVVSSVDGHVIGLASDRWPAKASVPTLELPILHSGNGDHIHIRTTNP